MDTNPIHNSTIIFGNSINNAMTVPLPLPPPPLLLLSSLLFFEMSSLFGLPSHYQWLFLPFLLSIHSNHQSNFISLHMDQVLFLQMSFCCPSIYIILADRHTHTMYPPLFCSLFLNMKQPLGISS